jgi:hypothetical protein
MYGGQPRSSMPCVSQAPRNRTTSRSTRVTSSITNATTLAFPLTSASKFGSASARTLPMSLMLVPSLPFIVSIFSITRDCRAMNEPEKIEIGWAERIAKLAVFSAIAELSAKGSEPRAWDIGLLEAGTSVHCWKCYPRTFGVFPPSFSVGRARKVHPRPRRFANYVS